jgi:uncharacterized protein YfaP (DUF2135 family)
MFNKVVVDILFILLMSFVALFFLAFVQINKPVEEEANAKNDNNILITMRWTTNNDMDLHLKLPDGRRIFYANRDEPPAHLDVDVVAWRRYQRDGYSPDMSHDSYYDESGYGGYDYGEYEQEHQTNDGEYVIKINEEIVTIRDVLEGEYIVNVHYFSARGYGDQPIEVEVVVQDVKNKKMIYADKKIIRRARSETHFVRFTITGGKKNRYTITKVYSDRPTYFIGEKR